MTTPIAVLALIGVAGTSVSYAGSARTPMTVSVTVARSCAVETRADDNAPVLRLTCATGARSTLKVSKIVQPPSTAVSSDGTTVLTLNF